MLRFEQQIHGFRILTMVIAMQLFCLAIRFFEITIEIAGSQPGSGIRQTKWLR